ncbi:hypothetical protein D6779_02270, partial [Candidatus Parcubacteria bacterium]
GGPAGLSPGKHRRGGCIFDVQMGAFSMCTTRPIPPQVGAFSVCKWVHFRLTKTPREGQPDG